jgi:hypothetical protein
MTLPANSPMKEHGSTIVFVVLMLLFFIVALLFVS